MPENLDTRVPPTRQAAPVGDKATGTERVFELFVCPVCGWWDKKRFNAREVRCGGRCKDEWRLANNRTGEGFRRVYGARRADREGIAGMTVVGDSDNYPLCVRVEAVAREEADRD